MKAKRLFPTHQHLASNAVRDPHRRGPAPGRRLLALAVAVGLAAGLPALAQEPEGARLTVTGEGQADMAPDMATVMLGVRTEAATAGEALAENNRRLAAVLARLRADGIADRDLQTSGLSLGPRLDYGRNDGPPRVVGYEASNQLGVRVRELSKLGAILDIAVADGANTFDGLNFSLSDPGPALDTARLRAVAEARRKAELIAGAAGVRLGPILQISEQARGGPMPMMRASPVVAEAAVPIAEGEVSYAASVTIVYRIEAE